MQASLVALLSLLATAAVASPVPQGDPEQPCTTTKYLFPHFNLSPTTTVYAATATAINALDCGGCVVHLVNRLGHGPVRHITATVTSEATTTLQMNQCTETNAVDSTLF